MPNSDELAYCDRAQNANQILLPTHSKDAIYYDDKNGYQAIAGESVTLQPALKRQGLIWRYLDLDVRFPAVEGLSANTWTYTKVCGRSLWDNTSSLANDYYGDETNQSLGGDIISLPPPPESHRG